MLYRRCGVDAVYTPQGGVTYVNPVRVIFDTPGGIGLDGDQQMLSPVVRVQVSQVATVPRDSTFVIAGNTYKAREAGLPVLDGAELHVTLKKG